MDDNEPWPPLLSSAQMHEAVETTITWANRSLQRFDELQGCALQMHNYALMVREFAQRQIDAEQPYLFLCEDRQRLRHRLLQTSTTMDVIKRFIDHTQRDAIAPLVAIADACDQLEQECVQVICHDTDEDNEVEIP